MIRWIPACLAVSVLIMSAGALGQEVKFDGKIAAGHALYLAGDFDGAVKTYQEAKEINSGRAEVYYFLGWALAGLEKYAEATATLKTAATIAGEKNLEVKGKALFSVAAILERIGDRDGAKEAWTDYLGFAQTHTDATVFIEVAQARLEAIEQVGKLEKDFAGVKEKMLGSAAVDASADKSGGETSVSAE